MVMKTTSLTTGILTWLALAIGCGCAEDPAEAQGGAGQGGPDQGVPDGQGRVRPAITAECVPGGAPLALVKSASPAECTPGGYWVQPAELVNCTTEAFAIGPFATNGCLRMHWANPSATLDEIFADDIARGFPPAPTQVAFFPQQPLPDLDGDGAPGLGPNGRMPLWLGGHPDGIDAVSLACGLTSTSESMVYPAVLADLLAGSAHFQGTRLSDDLALDLPEESGCLVE